MNREMNVEDLMEKLFEDEETIDDDNNTYNKDVYEFVMEKKKKDPINFEYLDRKTVIKACNIILNDFKEQRRTNKHVSPLHKQLKKITHHLSNINDDNFHQNYKNSPEFRKYIIMMVS